MAANFLFNYSQPKVNNFDRTVVIFCGYGFDFDDYEDDVKLCTDRGISPQKLLLILNDDDYKAVCDQKEKLGAKSVPLREKTDIYLTYFDRTGHLSDPERVNVWGRVSDELSWPTNFREDLVRQGATQIFRRRGGQLDAGLAAYFTNSQQIELNARDRRRYFLRASNALSEGSEVLFVAFSLLPHLSDDLTRVHVDTSTISSAVYAAFLLRKSNVFPEVHNFRSYQGIDKYDFKLGKKSLVVISASQSGNLFEKVKRKVDDSTQILTLFKLSNEIRADERVVCDLRVQAGSNPEGYGVPAVLDHKVVKGLTPLRMLGEQFVVGLSQAKGVTPEKRDLPKDAREILQRLLGGDVFTCFQKGYENDVYPIWVEPSKIVDSEIFLEWIDNVICRNIPASTQVIIYLDGDEGSELAAIKIQSLLKPLLLRTIPIVSHSLLSEIKDYQHVRGAVIVVGGAIGRGRKFLQTSQSLRDRPGAGPRSPDRGNAARRLTKRRQIGNLAANLIRSFYVRVPAQPLIAV